MINNRFIMYWWSNMSKKTYVAWAYMYFSNAWHNQNTLRDFAWTWLPGSRPARSGGERLSTPRGPSPHAYLVDHNVAKKVRASSPASWLCPSGRVGRGGLTIPNLSISSCHFHTTKLYYNSYFISYNNIISLIFFYYSEILKFKME